MRRVISEEFEIKNERKNIQAGDEPSSDLAGAKANLKWFKSS